MAFRYDEWMREDGLVAIFTDATAKATMLLLFSCLLSRIVRRSSAALRHRIWSLTLCGLIALPLAFWIVPGWHLPVFPAPGHSMMIRQRVLRTSIGSEPDRTQSPLSQRSTERLSVRGEATSPDSRFTDRGPIVPQSAQSIQVEEKRSTVKLSDRVVSERWTLAGGLLAIWSAGFLAAALPTLIGFLVNEWNRRQSQPVLGVEWRILLDALRRSLSIGRQVELRQGQISRIPLTWGVVRPIILLPYDAQGWTEPRRRAVLLHELAHVRRLDAGFQLAGRLAAALFWFHPLAWYALHRLRLEAEQACDDCVILAGERPTDYAHQLLDLARSVRTRRFSTALAMARSNTLERRVKAMFDETRSHSALSRRAGRRLAAGTALLVLALASAHPVPLPAGPDEPVHTTRTAAGIVSEAPPKGASRIAGRVIRSSDGKTVAGADVILLPPPPNGQEYYYGQYPLQRTASDVNGAFTFDGLAPGRYRVWANLGKLTSRSRKTRGEVVILPESGMAPKPVELRLAPGVLVTAQVKDTTGRPIPNATVHIAWSGFIEDFTTDRNGMVRIQPLTAEPWHLEVWADGSAKVSRWINLENGSDAKEEFRLGPGGELEGVIRDPSGKPLVGVRISAFAEGVREQFSYVETGNDGRFRHSHLPLGLDVRLDASKNDFLRKEVTTHMTVARQTLDLTMEPRPNGGSITGRVVDPDGRPIIGAEILNTGMSSDLEREAKTGPDGRFRLDDLFEGSLGKEVLVRGKGFAPKRLKVETGPPDRPAEVTISLERGHRIKGRVIDEKGRPLEGVRVYFSHGNHAFSDGGRATTDGEGGFAFDSLPAGSPFAFSMPGYSAIADRRLTLDSEEVISVTMVASGVIIGRVMDARTGNPIRAFNVQITFSPKRRVGEPSTTLMTRLVDPGQSYQSAEGQFTLGELVHGMPLQVMVSAEGYERRVAERVVASRPDLAKVEEFRLDPIDPGGLRTYRGRLRNEHGNPVAGAQVRLIAARDRDPDRRRDFPFNWTMIQTGQLSRKSNVSRFLESTTDAQGGYEFTRVPAKDEVEIAWWGIGIPPGRSDHLERVNQQASLDIAVPTPARILVSFDGETLAGGGRVQVNPSGDLSDRSDQELKPGQKEYEFPTLAAGEYTVYLMSPYERVPGTSNGLTQRTLSHVTVIVASGETKRVELKR